MTSSDPISETTPEVPLTVPDTGTATDIFFSVTEESIFFQKTGRCKDGGSSRGGEVEKIWTERLEKEDKIMTRLLLEPAKKA